MGGNDNSFFQRVLNFRPPQTFAEGLVKGLMLGGVISSQLETYGFIEFEPSTAVRVVISYIGFAFLVGAWGAHNAQQAEPDPIRNGL